MAERVIQSAEEPLFLSQIYPMSIQHYAKTFTAELSTRASIQTKLHKPADRGKLVKQFSDDEIYK